MMDMINWILAGWCFGALMFALGWYFGAKAVMRKYGIDKLMADAEKAGME